MKLHSKATGEGGTMNRPVQSGAPAANPKGVPASGVLGVDPYGPVVLSSPGVDKATERWGFAALVIGGVQ